MSALPAYEPPTSYLVMTRSTTGRPDTKIGDVKKIDYEGGVVTLWNERGLLFLADIAEIVYLKALDQ